MALSGTVNTSTYSGDGWSRYCQLAWTATQDSAANKSTIAWTLTVKGSGGNRVTIGEVSITINGAEAYYRDTSAHALVALNGTVCTGTIVVPHNNDGTKTFAISVGVGIYEWAINKTGYGTFTLDPFARTSTLTVANGTLGESQSLTITKAGTSFTHTITYSCGSATGTVITSTSNSVVSFTPPLSLAAQNISGNSVTVTYTLTTLSGTSTTGTSTATATYAIPDTVKPTLSTGWASVSYYNTDTSASSIGAFVQGYSKAQVSFDISKVSFTSCYGAGFTSFKISFNGTDSTASTSTTHRTQTITGSGTLSVRCYVYDSRGHYAYEDLTFTVYPYANPTLSDISVFRCNSEGEPHSSGTYASAKAKANISSINSLNSYTLRMRYKVTEGQYGGYYTLESETALVFGGGLISTSNTYVVEISLTDSLSNQVIYTVTIPTETVTFNMKAGGLGVAFGKYSEANNAVELASGWSLKIGDTSLSEQQLIALLNLLS